MKKRIIGTVVSMVIIVAMVMLSEPETLLENLSRISIDHLMLVLVLYFVNLGTKAYRWHLLVNASGMKARFKDIFKFFVIGLGLNNVTPGKVGGDVVRIFLLKKECGIPTGHGLASIFSEKMMDLTVVTTIAIVGVVMILPLLSRSEAVFLMSVLVLIAIALVAIIVLLGHSDLLSSKVTRSVNKMMKASKRGYRRKLGAAITRVLNKVIEGWKLISKDRRMVLGTLTLTIIIWFNEAIRLYIILLALPGDIVVGMSAVLIASSVATILSIALPLGGGALLGIGTVFVAVGVDPSMASLASLIQVATSIWISVPICLIAILVTGLKVSKVTEALRSDEPSRQV